MHRRPFWLAACAALLLVSRPLVAQDAEREVLETVQRLFDGMRQRDTALIRSLFEPGTRLVATGTREGQPYVRAIPIDRFIEAVGSGQGAEWIERIYHTQVKVSDNLASVWTWYTFHRGEQLSHCGVDAFHLAREASGWKIVALADTRRETGCEQVPAREPSR